MSVWKSEVPNDDGTTTHRLLRAPKGDEAAARNVAAGRGKQRDERYLTHDQGAVVSEVDHEGNNAVLYEWTTGEAAAPAQPESAEAAQPAGGEQAQEGGQPA